MKGMTDTTAKLFVPLSKLECIKPYILVGGTALAMQIDHRRSEDLDFMKWSTTIDEVPEVDWYGIQEELRGIGEVQHTNILGFDHAEFMVDGVKVSFYATTRHRPQMSPIHSINNIWLADIDAIGAMKMEVLLRRSNFRDYYDIYAILREGRDFNAMMQNALVHSAHRLKSKNLIAMLTDASRFRTDEGFSHLAPKYSVSASDIETYLRGLLR